MRFLLWFLLLATSHPVWSQSGWQHDGERLPSPEQQWREELRSSLQTRHTRPLLLIEATPQQPAAEPPRAHHHHLSAQERLELRQQLHQQYLEALGKRAKLPVPPAPE